MKKYSLILTALILILGSCAGSHITRQEDLPPGQAKKIHGDQSARAYAPGQQKKQEKKQTKGKSQQQFR